MSELLINSEKYVLDPIREAQMAEIEERIGQKIPGDLRDLVSKVGFLQNAIGGDWPQSANEFIEMQEGMPGVHVAFMGDGAGNSYVVSADNRLLFWDHETGEFSEKHGDFKSFINDLLREPVPLDELSWHVQLAFDVNQDQAVIKLLVDNFGLNPIGDWEYQETSVADVSSYHLRFKEDEKPGVISKLSYDGWDHDSIFFNRTIPISALSRYRQMFDDFESDKSLRFTLIDYGIMRTDIGNEDDI